MDRDEIERSDFPSARRGYDRDAVDAHLRMVADEVTRRRAGSLAEGASTQVRTILEAAEAGARELREEAGREATAHVTRVEEAANELGAKLEQLHGELDRLFAGLTDTAASLSSALERLSRDVGTLGTPAHADDTTDAAPAVAPTESDALADAAPADAAAAPPTDGARSRDEAGARLVALNMALEGAPRADTARFLGEHYELADLEALLDDVYESAGR